jgi:hypothetical protein
MDEPPSNIELIDAKKDEAMDAERKFLEGLLKERFNFFLVSAPVFLFGVFQAKLDDTQRRYALAFGILVFLLATLSILRTNLLVGRALDRLSDTHPYKVISKDVIWLPRANSLLVCICFVITGLMVVLFITTSFT